MKYAWIENNKIRDIALGNPLELYHPDIAKLYNAEVPDNAVNGDGWVNNKLVKPEVVVPIPQVVEVVPPKVSPIEFKLLFTPQERVAIKAARTTDAVIDDFLDIVEDTRLSHVDLALKSTQDCLSYLVSKSIITMARKAEILLGQIK